MYLKKDIEIPEVTITSLQFNLLSIYVFKNHKPLNVQGCEK